LICRGSSVVVIEHQAQQKYCPNCHEISTAPFPEDVRAPVQYGAALGAVGVYLVQQQLLPYERACEVLEDLLGSTMSVGTLAGLVERCAEQLAPVEQQIKAALSRAEVLHQDETGLYVAGTRHWMHESRDRALDPTQPSIPHGGKRHWTPSASWWTLRG
jgi:transposase